jgi:uncharacterized protein YkwD
VKPSRKLLAGSLSILAIGAATGLVGAPVAAASGPIAKQSATHASAVRAHEARCKARSHRKLRGCKASVSRKHARPHVKHHPATPTPSRSSAAAAGASAQRVAAIAAALSATCANAEITPEEGNIPLVRTATLCLINRERAQNGVEPLIYNPKLEAAAEGHCSELIADDYFAHISPTGETPVDRIRTTGYIPGPSDGYVIGENLAWGTYILSTPQAIVSAWIASPEHLANILEAKYTETGFGVTPAVPSSVAGEAPGATYAEEFGVIIP